MCNQKKQNTKTKKQYDFSEVIRICKNQEDFERNWYRLPWNAITKYGDIFDGGFAINPNILAELGNVGDRVCDYSGGNIYRRRGFFDQITHEEKIKNRPIINTESKTTKEQYNFGQVSSVCKDQEDFETNWYLLPRNAIIESGDILDPINSKMNLQFVCATIGNQAKIYPEFRFFRRRKDTFTKEKASRPIFKPTPPEPSFEPKIGQIAKVKTGGYVTYEINSLGNPVTVKQKEVEHLLRITSSVKNGISTGTDSSDKMMAIFNAKFIRATQQEVDKFLFEYHVNEFEKLLNFAYHNYKCLFFIINTKEIVEIYSYDNIINKTKTIIAKTKNGDIGFIAGSDGLGWQYVGIEQYGVQKLDSFLFATDNRPMKETLKIYKCPTNQKSADSAN